MTDQAAARVQDLKDGLRAVKRDVDGRALRDGSNLSPTDAARLAERLAGHLQPPDLTKEAIQTALGYEPAKASAVAAKANKADVYTKEASDGRYRRSSDNLGISDIQGLGSALGALQPLLEFTPARTTDLGVIMAQIGLSLARLTSGVYRQVDGMADDFQTTSGVSAATGFAHDNTAKSYKQSSEAAPLMTAASAPSGHVAAASSEYSASYAAWMAFDGNAATYWCQASTGGTPWLQRKLPSAKVLTRYSLMIASTTDGYPKAWTLQGSNNGTTWADLDSRTGQTFVSGETKSFSVSTSTAYAYYRLAISSLVNYGSVTDLGLDFFSTSGSLTSVAYSAFAAPSQAQLVVRAKGTSSLVAGTDIKGFVSRDNGTTWVEANLIAVGSVAGFTQFEAMEIDLTATPSGTQMRWRVEVSGGKVVEIDALALQWSRG